MRISRIAVDRWGTTSPFDISLPLNSKLICLVGDNGAGKSRFLDLLSSLLARIGFAQPSIRGQRNASLLPDIKIAISIDLSDSSWIRDGEWISHLGFSTTNWDGVLVVSFDRSHEPLFRASGMSNMLSAQLGEAIRSKIVVQQDVKHVHIDADRSYPLIETHILRSLLDQNLRSHNDSQSILARVLGVASTSSDAMYRDWYSYLVELDSRLRSKVFGTLRTSRDSLYSFEDFISLDPLSGFRTTLGSLLPHIQYLGPDPLNEQLMFRVASSQEDVPFHFLSGGERELVFLCGQVERFQLRKGLFLLDEPELHLNPSLTRRWLSYLRDTVTEGQVWIATHSLEAVEIAGEDSTIVFERTYTNNHQTTVSRLDSRPAMKVLASALGTPAFSIANQKFIAVEGEPNQGEADRFHNLIDLRDGIHFIERGTAKRVIDWRQGLLELASRTKEQLVIGAVIDRDYRTVDDAAHLATDLGIYVLSVREMENLFLHPASLELAMKRLARSDQNPIDFILSGSDSRAGSWILDRANSFDRFTQAIQGVIKPVLIHSTYADIDTTLERLVSESVMDTEDGRRALEFLRESQQHYKQIRTDPNLWEIYDGKKVLEYVAKAIGLSSRLALEKIVTRQWQQRETVEPSDLPRLRAYIDSL